MSKNTPSKSNASESAKVEVDAKAFAEFLAFKANEERLKAEAKAKAAASFEADRVKALKSFGYTEGSEFPQAAIRGKRVGTRPAGTVSGIKLNGGFNNGGFWHEDQIRLLEALASALSADDDAELTAVQSAAMDIMFLLVSAVAGAEAEVKAAAEKASQHGPVKHVDEAAFVQLAAKYNRPIR